MTFGKFTGSSDKPFHSSIYAEAASGGSMGTTSPQSFGYRRHIERNRRAVGRYSDSYVAQRSSPLHEGLRHRLESPDDVTDADRRGRSHGHWQPQRTYGMREAPASTPGGSGKPASPQKLQVPPRKNSFKEPPPRFNPYQ